MALRARQSAAGDPDAGGIVLGWLVKVVLVLTIAGGCLFDGVSVALAHLRATDDAAQAATAASEAWQRSGSTDLQGAYDTASRLAASKDEQVPTTTFHIDPDATVHLRLRGTAATLLLHRLPRMDGLTRVEVDGSGRAMLS